MQATPKEDMFMGSQSECVIHNHHLSQAGYTIRISEFNIHTKDDNTTINEGTCLAEAVVTTQKLAEMSGTGQQKIELTPKVEGMFDDENPFVKCRVQGFRWDNY